MLEFKGKNPGDTPSATLISIQINVHIYGIHTSRVDLSPAPLTFIVDMNTKTFSLSELNNFWCKYNIIVVEIKVMLFILNLKYCYCKT